MKDYQTPTSLAEAADKLYTLKNERLKLQKVIDEYDEEEGFLKRHLIEELPKINASGISGVHCKVGLMEKQIPQIKDWEVFFKHILETGEFDLLTKTPVASAVSERWKQGLDVPGIEVFKRVYLSIGKAK